MIDQDFLDELQMLKQRAKRVRRDATMLVQMAARLQEAATETDTSKEDTNDDRDTHQD